MAITTVNLESRTVRIARAHRVYLKAKWKSDWERVPWLFADEVAWRLAPSLSTASLTWSYGQGMRQGETSFKTITKIADARRLFVKIEIDAHPVTAAEIEAEQQDGESPDPLKWYGTIEMDGSTQEGLIQTGVRNGQPVYTLTGDQPLVAIGLEYALYQRPIRGATWIDSTGKEQRSELPMVFNRLDAAGQPDGNRGETKGSRAFVFASNVGHGAAKKWDSRKICQYVCGYEVPTGPGGVEQFPLAVDPDTEQVVPDWDTPVIDPAGLSAGELLNVVLPRSRMLSWRMTVHEIDEGETVFLTPVSLLGSDVVTDLGSFKKNWRQIHLQASITADGSPDAVHTLKDSEIGRIDQARVRGARRTTTCTVSKTDNSIDEGWDLDLEVEYNQGFSTASGYAALGTDGKQTANAEVRHTDRLFAVYRRFAMPRTWDQTVKNGLGAGNVKAVFMKTDNDQFTPRLVCPRELEVAPTLPLVNGFDYQSVGSLTNRTPPTKLDDGPHRRVAALVLFKTPEWAGAGDAPYVQVDAVGSTAVEQVNIHQNRHWSAQVETPGGDRAVLLHVHGEPQHVIAWTDFEQLPVDAYLGKWDWRNALFTVCLLDDRKAEGVYPSDKDADDRVVGMKRELVIEAGDAYKQDYLVPGTVIGVDKATRQPVRCTNGGWINDDRKLLAARARQVFEYYGQTRRSLVLATPLINSQVQPGDYVVDFGSSQTVKSIGTVVSEIVVTIPGGEGAAPPPSVQYTTAFAELETVELLNKRPAIAEPTGRRGAMAEARG